MEIMRTLLILTAMCCVCLTLPVQEQQREKREIMETSGSALEKEAISDLIYKVNKNKEPVSAGTFVIKDLDIAYNIKRGNNLCSKGICLWPKADDGKVKIPYVISKDFSFSESIVIQAALLNIESVTCIKFIKQTSEEDYISYQPLDGCWSTVGRMGGKQTISLDKSGCIWTGVATHETLHTLGLQHEHVRKDRDNYVKVLWDNIQAGFSYSFDVLDTFNMDLTIYDYDSIMHYSKKTFSKNGMPTLVAVPNSNVDFGQNFAMSPLDIVKINTLYNCTKSTLSTTTTTTTTTTPTTTTTTTTTQPTTTRTTITTKPTTTRTTTTTEPTTTRTTTTTKPTTTRTITTTTEPTTTRTTTTTKPTTTRTTTTTTEPTTTRTTTTTTKPTTTRTTTTTEPTTTRTTTTTKPTTTRTTTTTKPTTTRTTTTTAPTTTRTTTTTTTTPSTTKVSTTSTTTKPTPTTTRTTTTPTPVLVASSGCGGVLTAPQGVITSPNFPNIYPNSAYCHWNISTNSKFQITFTDLDLEGYMPLGCFDKLQIYNGGYFISLYKSVFCGQKLPPSITSQRNTMQIIFTSDISVGGKGFRIVYETI